MSNLEHAHMLLRLAQEDLSVLKGMADANVFPTRVFGFHAQQAVEKAIKAWLSARNLAYPKIHDLESLASLLRDNQIPLPEQFIFLLTLTDFAVQFRYESYEEYKGGFDRGAVTGLVEDFLIHVQGICR